MCLASSFQFLFGDNPSGALSNASQSGTAVPKWLRRSHVVVAANTVQRRQRRPADALPAGIGTHPGKGKGYRIHRACRIGREGVVVCMKRAVWSAGFRMGGNGSERQWCPADACLAAMARSIWPCKSERGFKSDRSSLLTVRLQNRRSQAGLVLELVRTFAGVI